VRELDRAHATGGAHRQLIQRAACLGAIIEDYEARWAAGEKIEQAEYCSLRSSSRPVIFLKV
jgi:hypothetical protein